MTIIKTALVQGVAEMYLQNTKDTYKWEKLRFFWSITAIDMTTIQLSVFSTSCLFSSLPLLLREYISQAEWMYNAEGAGQGVGSHTAHFMAVFQSSFLIFLPPECGFCCTLTGPLFLSNPVTCEYFALFYKVAVQWTRLWHWWHIV